MHLSRVLLLVLVCVVWCGGVGVHGVIFKLQEKDFDVGTSLTYRVALWSPVDAPAGTGSSFFGVEGFADYTSKKFSGAGKLEIAFFHSDNLPSVGFQEAGVDGRSFCSSDGLLISDRLNVAYNYSSIPGPIFSAFPVRKSGLHYAVISYCQFPVRQATPDADSTFPDPSLTLSGKLSFVNPYGHLPGGYYQLLPFYMTMIFMYVLVAAIWGFLCARMWKELLPLQLYITGVLLLSLAESVCWFAETKNFNASGESSTAGVVMAVFFTLIRKTFARLLILLVVLGYSVIKNSLGPQKWKIITYTSVYLLAGGIFEWMNSMYRAHEIGAGVLVVFAFPVALLDALLYTWIFYSLMNTIQELTGRGQEEKLDMYKKFSKILMSYSALAFVWLIFVSFMNSFHDIDQQWPYFWSYDAFWEILYFVVLLAIMIIWRPTSDNQKFAYTELSQFDGPGTDEDAEGATIGLASHPRTHYRDAVSSISSSLPVGRGPATAPTGSFSLAEEEEDDLFDDEDEDIQERARAVKSSTSKRD